MDKPSRQPISYVGSKHTDVQSPMSSFARRGITPGRPKGAKNKLNADAKWIVNEAVRLNGGLEWITAWMKANPDLAIPMWCRAMVPRATEATKGEGIRVVIYNHAEHGRDKGAEALNVELAQAEDVSTTQAVMLEEHASTSST